MSSNRQRGKGSLVSNPEVVQVEVNNLKEQFIQSQERLNGNLERLWTAHKELIDENKREHDKILKETKKWPRGLAVTITLLSSLATGLFITLVNQVASKFVP